MLISTEKNLGEQTSQETSQQKWLAYSPLIVIVVAAIIYLGCIISPPSLMDDVDSIQAQIARGMLTSGDWVTARLDGLKFLEKPPLVYWMIAGSFRLFGVHDWAARIPIAVSVIGVCWLTAAFGTWAFGKRAGFYAGLAMATCVGLFLFTRILIPDTMLTFTIALAMWALLRVALPDRSLPAGYCNLIGDLLGGFCRVGSFENRPANHQISRSGGDGILRSDYPRLISGRGPGWTHSRSHDGKFLAERLAQRASFVGRGDQASTTRRASQRS